MAVEFLGKPLTVQRVLDAYAATGLKPVADAFVSVDARNARCGCALSAVAIAEGAAAFEEHGAHKFLGSLPPGFTSGFDGLGNSDPNEAYELGRQCRKAVGL